MIVLKLEFAMMEFVSVKLGGVDLIVQEDLVQMIVLVMVIVFVHYVFVKWDGLDLIVLSKDV